MSEFDFVIVGAGAAGCVLANRLSESGEHSVLVLEAGGSDAHLWVKVPAGFTRTIDDPSLNWGYVNAGSPATGNRPIHCPRGRVIGGSSSINGHLYVRGQRQDYDDWSAAGASGWDWNSLLPYFKRSEKSELSDLPGRGKSGNLIVSMPRLQHPLCNAFIRAANTLVAPDLRSSMQSNFHQHHDYNSGQQEGSGYYQYLMKKGRRWSAADAYLRPALKRENLTVFSLSPVTKLLIEGKHVVGVQAIVDGQQREIRARREVILAAGAIASPQLLQCSGIGDARRLSAIGVKPIHQLAGVGENLADHYAVRVSHRVVGATTLNERSHGLRLVAEVLKYVTARKGLLTSAVAHAYGFVRTDPRLERPDLQFFFAPASYPLGKVGHAKLDRAPGMTCGISQLRPYSRGYVRSLTADPLSPPDIQPNYLADERDVKTFVAGLRIVRRLFQAEPLSRFAGDETWPGQGVMSDDALEHFVRETGSTVYHPVGTCAMGNVESDGQAVVDSRLKVIGLQGLRVIDASVMPRIVSGNTYAATIVIAEKGSDLVLADVPA
ncbi:MAG: GMC family oxidoreductase N-terminal domain-containing protein [Burkholderiaceae bacterium]